MKGKKQKQQIRQQSAKKSSEINLLASKVGDTLDRLAQSDPDICEQVLSLSMWEIFRLMEEGVLDNPSSLLFYLRASRKIETTATEKLSELQKGILLTLYVAGMQPQTDGKKRNQKLAWNTQELFGRSSPSDRASFSRSLKSLEARKLVARYGSSTRTTFVKLTALGNRVSAELLMDTFAENLPKYVEQEMDKIGNSSLLAELVKEKFFNKSQQDHFD